MKLRIIAAVLLLAVIAGALWGMGQLRTQYADAQALNATLSAQLQELDGQAKELEQAISALNTDKAQAQLDQAEELMAQAEELKHQIAVLQTAMEEMQTYLEENQDAIAEAEAELTYLQGVYDELKEGLSQVEGYIAGN